MNIITRSKLYEYHSQMETDQTCSHPDKVDGSTPRPYDTVAGYNRKFYKTE